MSETGPLLLGQGPSDVYSRKLATWGAVQANRSALLPQKHSQHHARNTQYSPGRLWRQWGFAHSFQLTINSALPKSTENWQTLASHVAKLEAEKRQASSPECGSIGFLTSPQWMCLRAGAELAGWRRDWGLDRSRTTVRSKVATRPVGRRSWLLLSFWGPHCT